MLEQEAFEVIRQFDLLTDFRDAFTFVIDYVEENAFFLCNFHYYSEYFAPRSTYCRKVIMEKISIIVPVYNVAPYLPACLDSIIHQTYRNLEIILVDDGSTDSSNKICEQYKTVDPRIQVIHQENQGLTMARNAGISAASGKYISLIDSDDFIAPDMIEKLYDRLIKDHSDLSVCSIQYVDEDGQPLPSKGDYGFAFPDQVLTRDTFWKIYASTGHTACVITQNKLYKRELLARFSYPKGRLCEDEFVLHSLVEQCNRISSMHDRLFFYRQRRNSITGINSRKKKLDYIEACFERLDFFLEKRDSFMAEDTLLRLIASVERYCLEYKNADSVLSLRIKKYFNDVMPLLHSPKAKVTLLLYRFHLFPYKLVHTILCLRQKKKG